MSSVDEYTRLVEAGVREYLGLRTGRMSVRLVSEDGDGYSEWSWSLSQVASGVALVRPDGSVDVTVKSDVAREPAIRAIVLNRLGLLFMDLGDGDLSVSVCDADEFGRAVWAWKYEDSMTLDFGIVLVAGGEATVVLDPESDSFLELESDDPLVVDCQVAMMSTCFSDLASALPILYEHDPRRAEPFSPDSE